MNLGTVAARRLIVRRGVGALAALFVAGGSQKDTRSYQPAGPPLSGAPSESADQDFRRKASRKFFDRQHAMEQARWLKYRSWYEQDADLLVLQSTSPSWRASVMRDRLTAERTILDGLQKKISAIWEEPLAKVHELIHAWVGDVI